MNLAFFLPEYFEFNFCFISYCVYLYVNTSLVSVSKKLKNIYEL